MFSNGIRSDVHCPLVAEGTWTIEECTRFAVLKEFELLQLISKDKKAFATARRLGLYCSQPHPQPLLVLERLRLRRHQLPGSCSHERV